MDSTDEIFKKAIQESYGNFSERTNFGEKTGIAAVRLIKESEIIFIRKDYSKIPIYAMSDSKLSSEITLESNHRWSYSMPENTDNELCPVMRCGQRTGQVLFSVAIISKEKIVYFSNDTLLALGSKAALEIAQKI